MSARLVKNLSVAVFVSVLIMLTLKFELLLMARRYRCVTSPSQSEKHKLCIDYPRIMGPGEKDDIVLTLYNLASNKLNAMSVSVSSREGLMFFPVDTETMKTGRIEYTTIVTDTFGSRLETFNCAASNTVLFADLGRDEARSYVMKIMMRDDGSPLIPLVTPITNTVLVKETACENAYRFPFLVQRMSIPIRRLVATFIAIISGVWTLLKELWSSSPGK